MADKDQVDAVSEPPRTENEDNSVNKQDDSVDARFGGLSIGTTGADGDTQYRYRYKMNHAERGKFIIINNKTFKPETRMNERTGTDEDAASLYADFKKLGFNVELHKDRTKDQMLQIMIAAARENHSRHDCFGVAVLTHGDEGILYGIDDVIPIDNFVQPIKGCRDLAGKPKIFIFQACRGNELDPGIELEKDDALGAKSTAQRIPLEADFIYAYSTTPGYFSWRNSARGSWFIQALHKMLSQHATDLDFVKILTCVNYEVAYEFESNASQAHMTRKKQIPSIVSMLTKDLYFDKK